MSDLPRRVLVSFTQDQKRTAVDLAEDLAAEGFEPSLLGDSEQASERPHHRQDAVEQADSIVLLIGSRPTVQDRAEWKHVLEAHWTHPEKTIVPVVADDAKLPPGFAELRSVAFHTGGGSGGRAGALLTEVLDAISGGSKEDTTDAEDSSSSFRPAFAREFVSRLDAIGDVSRSYE